MSKKHVIVILGCMLVFCLAGNVLAQKAKTLCNISLTGRNALLNWVADYEMAPRAYVDRSIDTSISGGSFSLLNHLKYDPTERNQGDCRNSWVWAGTGVMAIALDVQEHALDRLSVQFVNSCDTEQTCCKFAMISDFAKFYATKGFAIPWSNTNANWQDGDGSCNVPCNSIATQPKYGIDSIVAETLETHGVSQSEAIANIKNVLHQNKAVYFLWFFPTLAEWIEFVEFWETQGEDVTESLNYCCGKT